MSADGRARLSATTPDANVTLDMDMEAWEDITPARLDRFRAELLRQLGRDPNDPESRHGVTWTIEALPDDGDGSTPR